MLLPVWVGIQQSKLPTPHTTAKIGVNLYINTNEITILDWTEFLYYIEKDSSEVFVKQMLPAKELNYYKGQNRRIPITQITYEQALAFCQWRTDFSNRMVFNDLGLKVVFRLPTEEEFKLATEYEAKYFKKRQKKLGIQIQEVESKSGKERLLPAYGRKREKKRVLGLFHNVREMLNEKGKAIGMSNWTYTPDFQAPVSTYDRPTFDLGFRCVVEFVD